MYDDPKRVSFMGALDALLAEPKPEPKPDWWKHLTKSREPQSPSLLAALAGLEPELNLSDKTTILAVWCKGKAIDGYDPTAMRYDSEGSIMLFHHHGNCDSEYGWQIDHIHPVSKGGTDRLSNLQPLNWKNNQRKKDKILPPPFLRLS